MRRTVVTALAIACLVGTAACEPKSAAPGPAAQAQASDLPLPLPADSAGPSAGLSPEPSPSEVPPPPPSPKPSASPKPATCQQGEHQQVVEQALAALGGYGKVTVDGRQSQADCDAIKKFQKRFDLRPVDGKAGPMTRNVAERLVASKAGACGAGSGLTACVDLTHQTVWLMNGGKIVYGPTVTRTGMKGYATDTGSFAIHDRQLKNWSEEWDVWLPYWQRVVGGSGFHQTTTWIHNGGIGSHGCINLLPADAVKFWNTLKNGTSVKIFGRRPGT
ncbi:L,D-transpeptidase family protein [Catellatospora sp. KI3]|uniref:L,D-transpeptidase family protein n=1 Tax=Catellatospora sp. KI3 TaxID=3041620 RepID=UPI002482DD0E|nr:L,D-transpeptidase family protein [Catellatospora sp. KI3]MDI1461960.1 L,D-transpeptidase family protein [Catellatospora sp. KI3]